MSIRLFLVVFATLSTSGCDLLGPSCVSRQDVGPVTVITGEVAPGQLVVHQVPYGTQGSQNDARLAWVGQSSPFGPRLRAYATRVACIDFRPPPANTGVCAILASAGWFEAGIASTLTVTHGRGNPEVLGSPPEYKIWLVNDSEQSARYTIDITYFFGPDC